MWSSELEAATYLAAFIDGEGYVMSKPRGLNQKRECRIGFTNSDRQLLDVVQSAAQFLGLEFREHLKARRSIKHAPAWDANLVGGKGAYRKFARLVPLRCERKKANLETLLAHYEECERGGYHRLPSLTDRRFTVQQVAHAARRRFRKHADAVQYA